MTTRMRPSDLGEPLLADLLGRLLQQQMLAALPTYRWCAETQGWREGPLGATTFFADDVREEVTFVPHGRLAALPDGKHFDGLSEVDVIAVRGASAFPMELKLGEHLLSARTFTKRFLGECEYSKHKSPRVSGSMCNILDRRLSDLLGESVSLRIERPAVQLIGEWGLVLRERVFERWREAAEPTERSPEFKHAPVILLFETIARRVQEGPFDVAVQGIVGSGFYRHWITESPPFSGADGDCPCTPPSSPASP